MNRDDLELFVSAALAEDVGDGDVTTDAIVPTDARSEATLLVKEPGIVCGLDAAEAVFTYLDPTARFVPLLADGEAVRDAPFEAAHIEGSTRALLTGERTALNLVGRLSGIATATGRYVRAVSGTGASILDTRKTTPGLRALEKYAVTCGGGRNHRFGLADGVLVKDNHLQAAPSLADAVARVRAATDLPVVVECETLAQLTEALEVGVDRVLLDNMSLDTLRAAVELTAGRTRLEASGGITLDNVRDVAQTGVDDISVGAITHSAPFLDVSLEVT